MTTQRKKIYLVTFIIVLVASFVFYRIAITDQPPDEFLIHGAKVVNSQSPRMVDENIRGDGAIALPNNTFQYNFSILNIQKGVTPGIENYKKTLEASLKYKSQTNPALIEWAERGTTIIYNYNDKDGNFLFKITISP